MNDLAVIASRLNDALAEQRIVLWEDPSCDYQDAVAAVVLDSATIIRVDRNEFGVKARVLVQQPDARFLLYRTETPPHEDPLLDIALAYGVFRADRVSMLIDTHSLDSVLFRPIIAEHLDFFNSSKRAEALKSRLAPSDTADHVRAKMSAVLGGSKIEHRMTDLMRAVLQENATGRSELIGQLQTYGLEQFLWTGADRIYGYRTASPSVDDFAVWMFACANEKFAATTDAASGRVVSHQQLAIDFSAWRSSRAFEGAYQDLSARAADALDIESMLSATPIPDLLDNFLYEAVDRRIIRELAERVTDSSLTHREVENITQTRIAELRGTRFEPYYRALLAASGLLTEVAAFKPSLGTFDEGIEQYATAWYRIDQLYRHYYTYAHHDKNDVLAAVSKKVESTYVFDYLHTQGLSWQQRVDTLDKWPQPIQRSASRFYTDHVRPVVSAGNRKLAVIISDAFRFEVADELRTRVRQADRFEAKLDPMVSVLPSYTQLGMAALLPHESLSLQSDAYVLVDGKPTKGKADREKFLTPIEGRAIRAEELLKMGREESRQLVVSCKVLYVYHDTIDALGDHATTEGRTFEAAQDAIQDILDLVSKLTNANMTNVIVTADHGFQYQEEGLEPQGFLDAKPKGEFVNRRFVLGHDLQPVPSLVTFTSPQLGLDGDVDVQIPKSTHRIVKPGAGTRYVHGGASLQEIVIPLLTINKARQSDTQVVEVKLLKDRDTITTGQLVIKLSQVDPVTEKVRARTLKIGLWADDELISNEEERTHELTTDDAGQRISAVTLSLSHAADAHEGRTVELRMRERVGSTNQWKNYLTSPYTLKRAILADF
ncbi:BREX-1 system phosphatase PglZ type A (plasmid) [Coraliomargarita sp. W4R53]